MQRSTPLTGSGSASAAPGKLSSQTSAQQQQAAPPIDRTIHFNQAQAIIWQVKFILNQISSKKALTQATNEIDSLSQKFGKDFDKYLLRELIEQIDLKDPVKAQKDKNEPFKVQLMTNEFNRCVQKPEFLSYFGEIACQNGFSERLGDFIAELTRRLKLNFTNQILIALSLVESCTREESLPEAIKILKAKLAEYFNLGRPEANLPDYALHRIMYLYSTHPEMASDENRENIQQYLLDSNTLKQTSHVSLRAAMLQDLMFANASVEESSMCLFKEGNGIDNLDKCYKMLEPWQLLLELGHMSSYNYNQLLKILEDFKDINEKIMARTLLNLSIQHTGSDDHASKIAQNTFEANRKSDSTLLKKEVVDKKNQVTWSVDNLVRAFRELFSHLNWQKVFEALSEITDEYQLDAKAFTTFLQITNKSKPQNLPYPLPLILQNQWASPLLQLSFIENSIQFYIEKKEKSINFFKAGERRQEMLEELTGIKEKVPLEFLHVWLSVDLVERLLILADSHYFHRVRQLFEAPLKQVPEYLLLTLSLCKANKGSLMIDELLSLLLPQFLGNHINSILVLQALWRNNQALMIRGICELCRHDQRIMNLSRVLDITQEVKESLIPIVHCEDYYFAVNLAILAGKSDFLHYDVWLQHRISDVGTPFIKALLKYIKEHIINPIIELQKRGTPAEVSGEQFEIQKQQVLERSHLSKEKLCITIENLSNPIHHSNNMIKPETQQYIKEVMSKLSELFPQYFGTAQNSEEIDNAANDFFQKVFSADVSQVDQKITELIEIMDKFRNSQVKKEQEIYACMLHSLFDEYRFIHKYPPQYLEKIAKLYGAIIKNQIIDGTLQEIALKFVVEAFRRDGKRMKFGVIVVRQIIDMLPQFPQYFDWIYDLRQNISGADPTLMKEIEELYESTMTKTARTRAPSLPLDEAQVFPQVDENIQSKYKSSFSSFSADSFDDRKEESKKKEAAPTQVAPMSKINESDFLSTFQQNAQQTSAATVQQQAPAQQQKKETAPKGAQKAAQEQKQQQSVSQAQSFNPTYKVRGSTQSETSQPPIQQQQPPVYAQPFQPTQQQPVDPQSSTTASQGLNPSSVAFSRKPGATTGSTNIGGVPTTSAPVVVAQAPMIQPVIAVSQGSSLSGIGSAPQLFPLSTTPSGQQQTTLQPTLSSSGLGNNQPPPHPLVNARPFKPAAMRSPAPQQAQSMQQSNFNQQFYSMQLAIEAKLQKAISENAKVKLEDVIEESNMPGSNIAEDVRKFLNTTGKGNLQQQLEEFKQLLNQNPTVYVSYFIHQILIKKITGQSNLIQVYIDSIKMLGQKDSISQAIASILEIFRKCMLINEEQLNLVAHPRVLQQGSQIKAYLCSLGSFLGQLTVANNRPIYSKELDIKQLLIEAFTSDKMKYAVIFVCRILKECAKSTIFKQQNPWVKANLEILKEIYDFSQVNNAGGQQNDVLFEIDGLYKIFGFSAQDINHTGFLKAAIHQQFTNQAQQVEVMHMINKQKIIPAVQAALQPQQQLDFRPPSVSPSPASQPFGGVGTPFSSSQVMSQQQREIEQMQQTQQFSNYNQIFQKVVLTPEFLSMLGLNLEQLQQSMDQLLRKVVSDAVDHSIVEILPPVVDRSVTIALITTRELVLKDFAYDSNYGKILSAADLIVQNLAGSLALVTCREPLKMQLTTNLKKSIQQQLSPAQLNLDPAALPALNEALITDLAQQASKDNLELGCKMIKKAVIQRALTKVREDAQIARAIEIRKMAQSHAEFRANFIDESLTAQYADLPQQLKPNENGLSDAQFQVYEDFANLSKQSLTNAPLIGDIPLDVNDDIEAYLKVYENLTSFEKAFEKSLGLKLQSLSAPPPTKEAAPSHNEQLKKLIQFCENVFYSLCERLSIVQPGQQQQQQSALEKNAKLLDFLSFAAGNIKIANEDMQMRLTQKFLGMDQSFSNNTQLTLNLMKREILSAQKWDSQIATYIRDSQQYIAAGSITKEMKELFQFLREFFDVTNGQSEFSNLSFPNVMAIIQKLAENDANIARLFQGSIQDHKQKTLWTTETLREYFNEWAVISLEEGNHPERQKQEVNRFFNNLKDQGLYRDPKVMLKFCKSMIELSVERALYLSDSEKRHEDRIVYRYIESFMNFLYISLQAFASSGDGMNKLEFLQQLFDAVHQVLDEDHRAKKGEFNQKPYYRILINILKLMSYGRILNSKNQQQLLFSLAELFNKLNPKEYPAFAFAWLELISHQYFMPEFLSQQPGTPQQQPQVPGKKPTAQAPQPQTAPQQPLQDNSSYIQKCLKFKDLIVHLFTFLKANLVVGQPMSEPLAKFYEATLRVILVIKNDYPEFLCDFHFNLVNSLPEHCVQLRNVILSAQPRNIPYIDPFGKNLKVDTLQEIQLPPRSQSNYENYLTFQNLREDLEKYFRSKEKDKQLIKTIAEKMMQSEEIINGRKRINSSIYNAVALFIQNCAHQNKIKAQAQQKECYEILKSIILILTPETRLCLLNSIVNELRYINSHTYFYSWMVIYLFNDVDEPIQEQITRILIERLQTHDPHPWGLCITFRELLQNPKYNFAKKSFVLRNQAVIEQLMQTKLQSFYTFWANNKQVVYQQQIQPQQQQYAQQQPQSIQQPQHYQDHQ